MDVRTDNADARTWRAKVLSTTRSFLATISDVAAEDTMAWKICSFRDEMASGVRSCHAVDICTET